jgi:hypothetical protein
VVAVAIGCSPAALAAGGCDIDDPQAAQTPSLAIEQPFVTSAAPTVDRQVIRQPAGPPPTPEHTGIKAMLKDLVDDVKHLPSKENLFWSGVGGGLALAVHPADESVNQAMVNSDFAKAFFKPGEVLGELPTLLSSAATVYAVGRVKHKPKVSHMGMDLIESLANSEGLTQAM